jgi:hypothetical protein
MKPSGFTKRIQGLVARTFAKLCPELGVDKSSFAVHHKGI